MHQASLCNLKCTIQRTIRYASDAKVAADVNNKRSSTYDSLNRRHRILAEGGIPPAIYEDHKFKWEVGERFGQFGLASGIDIRRLWPSVEEIEQKNALKMYRKLDDSKRIAQQTAQDNAERIEKRKENILKNLSSYDKQLEQFEQSRKKVETELSEQEVVQQRRIREIQEYFGYWIDPNDPRFMVMLKQKEAEESKAARKAKKEAKRAKQLIL